MILKLVPEPSRYDKTGVPNPSRIGQNRALEPSENDLGNKSVPKCLVLVLFYLLLTPLG